MAFASMALRLSSLLALLIAGASAQAVAPAACPAAGDFTTHISNIDNTNAPGLAYGYRFASSLANVPNAAACAALAAQYVCDPNFPATEGFYVYLINTIIIIDGSNPFTCVYGKGCLNMGPGPTMAQFGYVKPSCPSPPPPGKPVACPMGTGPAAKVSIDASLQAVSAYFGGKQQISFALDAASCKAAADWANCQGAANSFYLYSTDGFRSGDVILGNCAFGPSCMTMIGGSTEAYVGNTVPTCTPSPPPPAPYDPKLCHGGVMARKQCNCPRYALCQPRYFCPKPWVCRCLGQFKHRVEDKNGTLIACH